METKKLSWQLVTGSIAFCIHNMTYLLQKKKTPLNINQINKQTIGGQQHTALAG